MHGNSDCCVMVHSVGMRVPVEVKQTMNMNFMVEPCINNIKHFIVQLIHTNYKILRLLK